jgi:hypothetical protein
MESAEQAIAEVGEVAEGPVHVRIDRMASAELSLSSRLIRPLEIGTSIKINIFR